MFDLTGDGDGSVGGEVECASRDQAPARLCEGRLGKEDRTVREVLRIGRWFPREVHGVVAE
eukprot:10904729-Heterocapsa_arctica.AAC.1